MKLAKIASEQFAASLKTLMRLPKVPAKTMFAVRGVAKVIAEEAAKYEEMRSAVIEEFGERDNNGMLVKIGDNIKIQKDKVKEMGQKLKEIGNIEVKLNEIKFSDLSESGEAPQLTAEDLYQLEFIVE